MMGRPEMSVGLVPRWLAEECEQEPAHFERAGALWDSWRVFAKAERREPGTPAEFAREMEARGFMVDRLPGDPHRIRWGVRLRRGRVGGGR